MKRGLKVAHATTAAILAVVAPLSLLLGAAQIDVAIGFAALAAVVSGALARVRPAGTALGVALLVVYFLYGSASDAPMRLTASIGLTGGAFAYAGYAVLASVTNLSAGGQSL